MSQLEERLAQHLSALGIQYEREYRFHDTRRWRADFYIAPDLLIECEGITFYGRNRDGSMKLGRHQTAKGAARDAEKYNAAVEAGYRVLRYTDAMIRSGEAAEQIGRLVWEKR